MIVELLIVLALTLANGVFAGAEIAVVAQRRTRVLELVEEVESDPEDAAFWKPYLDRVLGAVELYDDGTGPLRTNLSGLENLRLETWELKAARRAVAEGGPALTERDRTLLRAVLNPEEAASADAAEQDADPAASRTLSCHVDRGLTARRRRSDRAVTTAR